jgi:hypothetical protein
VREIFLIDPTGVNGHAEVRRVRKLDLEDLRGSSLGVTMSTTRTYGMGGQ